MYKIYSIKLYGIFLDIAKEENIENDRKERLIQIHGYVESRSRD